MRLARLFRFLPVLIWMGVIFFFSAQSSLPSPPEPWLNYILKKGGHLAVYATLMVLLLRATRVGTGTQLPTARQTAVCFAILIGYALSDEAHQSLVPGRTPAWMDALVFDTGGGLAGWFVWRWCVRHARSSGSESV